MTDKSHLFINLWEAHAPEDLRHLELVPEYRFHDTRKWRFDCAFPAVKIAVEIEGGVWVQGRHTRGSGYLKDLEKYNTAASRGWVVFRFATNTLEGTDTNMTPYEAVALVSDAIRLNLN